MPRKQLIEIEGRELALSNAEKIYFPRAALPKAR
jgi:hypothetical protein